jgi:predicted RNA polymerase sigma factor
LEQALSNGTVGLYQLQAAIAAIHDEAQTAEDTDWPQILALYELLRWMSDNPMIRLNHAVAVGMVNGPVAGLKLLDEIEADGQLVGHHRMDSVRANLLERVGDRDSAISYYRTAADRATSIPERNYLMTQAARLAKAGRVQ